MKKEASNWKAIVGTVLLLGIVVLFLVWLGMRQVDDALIVPASTYSPAIPESNQSAKEYIDRASVRAEAGEYREAVTILEEGLAAFPADQNLQLTKEYYENEAARHGQ